MRVIGFALQQGDWTVGGLVPLGVIDDLDEPGEPGYVSRALVGPGVALSGATDAIADLVAIVSVELGAEQASDTMTVAIEDPVGTVIAHSTTPIGDVLMEPHRGLVLRFGFQPFMAQPGDHAFRIAAAGMTSLRIPATFTTE